MLKDEVIKIIKKYNFPKEEYKVYAGTAMVLHGLRENTSDIDIICTTNLFNDLIEKYDVDIKYKSGERVIILNENIEIFEELNMKREIIYIDEIPTETIESLYSWKTQMNREKDQEDIKRLKKELNIM